MVDQIRFHLNLKIPYLFRNKGLSYKLWSWRDYLNLLNINTLTI